MNAKCKMQKDDCGDPTCRNVHWQGHLRDTESNRTGYGEARHLAAQAGNCLLLMPFNGHIFWARVPMQVAG